MYFVLFSLYALDKAHYRVHECCMSVIESFRYLRKSGTYEIPSVISVSCLTDMYKKLIKLIRYLAVLREVIKLVYEV